MNSTRACLVGQWMQERHTNHGQVCAAARDLTDEKGVDLDQPSDTPASVEGGRFTLAVYTSVTFVWPPLNVGDPHVSL